jgi:hypothetical protein
MYLVLDKVKLNQLLLLHHRQHQLCLKKRVGLVHFHQDFLVMDLQGVSFLFHQ